MMGYYWISMCLILKWVFLKLQFIGQKDIQKQELLCTFLGKLVAVQWWIAELCTTNLKSLNVFKKKKNTLPLMPEIYHVFDSINNLLERNWSIFKQGCNHLALYIFRSLFDLNILTYQCFRELHVGNKHLRVLTTKYLPYCLY